MDTDAPLIAKSSVPASPPISRSVITCRLVPRSRTASTTIRRSASGIGSVGTQATALASTSASQGLPDNGHTQRRKHRKLRQADAFRRSVDVVEDVREHVLRVVRVHDAEEG